MMRLLPRFMLLAVVSACAVAGDEVDPTLESALGGTASISLASASARMTQTSDAAWTLDKEGAVNPATSTVTWTITAVKGATIGGHLVIHGTFTVTNKGSGGATIGNIVVNLQTKTGGRWVTRSSDVANATQGDLATTANIYKNASSEGLSTITENAASGELQFMDASTNTLFSLVPQVTIDAGATRTLLFSASFDNNVLGLATGTPTRAEIIVSFGNAATSAASAPNIDINGNGVIDADEARVRSVPARLGFPVPAQVPGNATATLTDTLADITTTGTVSFSNAVFNLGATSGTVSVRYDAGANGGSITNCAHLTTASSTVSSGGFNFPNIIGLDLKACDTQPIGAPPSCSPGAPGCGWAAGDVVSFTQGVWGDETGTAAPILVAGFDDVYFGLLEVGIPGAAGFSMRFSSGQDVVRYLPASGANAALTSDLNNPTSSASGAFGGTVTALELNIDFTDAGIIGGTAGLAFGDLRLCGHAVTGVNGLTLRQFLGLVETLLGGGSNGFSIAQLAPIATEINGAFTLGDPSSFAQDHLVAGACP